MIKNLPYDRSERVADAIFEVVSEAVNNRLADPRVKGVRITRVSVTRDLRTARVCYHLGSLPESARVHAQKGLVSAAGFLKRRIGGELELKFMPEIVFYYDEGVDTG